MTMRDLLRRYVTPPTFAGNGEKTRAAAVLNVLQLALAGIIVLASIAVVFVFTRKLESLAVVIGLAIAVATSRVLMYRGCVRCASLMAVAGIWILVTLLLAFGGGFKSVDALLYIALTVIGGLLLGPDAAIILGLINALTGLGFVISEHMGYTLPQLFPNMPLSNWVKYIFGLTMVVVTLNIALRDLRDALALAQQRLEQRRAAEQERERLLVRFQEQARQVQQVMDTVPEGVLLLDEEGRVVSANRLGQQDLQTLAGVNIGSRLTHLADRPLAELLASPPHGLWHELELGARNFQALARPIKSGEKAEGWVLVIRDVTQHKLIEQRSQQQDRLAAVGQLAAGIAHDFNNIMATVVLYAQMSMREAGVPTKVQERLITIYQQALHATQLIQQILDFSHRAILERRPFDLLPLLKEEIELLERILPENIVLRLDYDPHAGYVLNGSSTAIQQVLMNLAVNARDAMPNGGMLYFDLARFHVEETDADPIRGIGAGEWIKLTVADTGAGIPADVLPHIFDPFFTTKEPGMGTGLGLAQVYGIVGMHEGQIRVETQEGAGATFIIYLPAMMVAAPENLNAGVVELATGQGQTILVVEDSPITRQALADSLVALDYRVQVAENGQQALAILEERPEEIDLVLSDVVMPGMGGIGLIEAMRQRGLDTPVVLLTGHPLKKDWEHLNVAWILKPPSLETLAHVIAQALTGGNYEH